MIWNDEKTAADVAAAVKQLYQLEAGEKGPLNGLNLYLRGMSIGNGYFSNKYSMATSMDFLYYHGVIGKNDYDSARKCCVEAGQSSCQFNFSIDGCPERLSGLFGLFYNYHIDVYNIYQKCYEEKELPFGMINQQDSPYLLPVRRICSTTHPMMLHSAFLAILLTKLLIICNKNISDINENYIRQYNNEDRDMTSIFKDIISSKYVDQLADPFKILIYNGDADLACTFLEAEFFIDNLVDDQMGLTIAEKQPWFYSEAKTPDVTVAAGFRKSFEFSNTKENAVILDLLTVKGAGHLVPTDRPAPAMQMLYNFLGSQANYSVPVKYSLSKAALKQQYQPNAIELPEPDVSPDDETSETSSPSPPPPGSTTSAASKSLTAYNFGLTNYSIALFCLILLKDLF
uniref:Serine carboxypeptidase n=1 Tax=Ditylenchus dipsaci TaxID=166011 RepID=A0A915EKA0_9BILA